MKVIIVGGGASGSNCAARLRRLDEKAEIVILEKTNDTASGTCGLPYYFSGVISDREKMIVTKPETFKNLMNIDVHINSEVTSINRKEKYVTVNGKDKFSYDKLVLALGASALRPGINGANNKNVFTVKTLKDIDDIKSFIESKSVKKAVIVGGGAIGIEMAEGFVELKIKTSLVEADDKLLPNVDKEIAVFAQNELKKNGVSVYVNESVSEIADDHVKLKSGKIIESDIVILAAGTVSDTAIAAECGLATGLKGAIIVNEHMQTSDENIYACGDSVITKGFISGEDAIIQLAGFAGKQGRIVAENICSIKSKYHRSRGTAIVKVFDLSVASTGLNEKQLNDKKITYKKIHTWSNTHASYYPGAYPILIKLLFDNSGKLLGAQTVAKDGADKRIDVISTSMQFGATVGDLADLELCYAPPYSSAKDPVNIAGMAGVNVQNGTLVPAFFDDISKDSILIDVRPPHMFKEGTIKGAINIPAAQIRQNLGKIPKDKKIILFCVKGFTSYSVLKILEQCGFDNVYSLSGGITLYNELMSGKSDSLE